MVIKHVAVALTFLSALATAPAAHAQNDGFAQEEHPVLSAAAEQRASARAKLAELRAQRDLAQVAPEAPRSTRTLKALVPALRVAPVEVEMAEPCALTPSSQGQGLVCVPTASAGALAAK